MKSIFALLIFTLILTTGLSAQQRLTMGQNVKSKLDSGSMTLRDGSYYEMYRYDSPGDETIVLTMESSHFDTYVMIGRMKDNAFERLGFDDDSGDGTDSRLSIRLAAAGTYYIRANTDNTKETGTYSIHLMSDTQTVEYATVPTIQVGDRITGVLNLRSRLSYDNTYYDPYLIAGMPNTTVSITLESGDFDAYLLIGRVGGEFETLESDDDSAGDTNAQLVFTFTDSSTYEIRANTLSEGEVGAYDLRIELGPLPAEPLSMPDLRFIGIDGQLSGEFTSSSPTLEDESHFEDILISGVPSTTIVIRLVSDDFDSYLDFGRLENGEFSSIETNDDCIKDDVNSCVTYTFEDDGVYVIRANTLSGGEIGVYQVTVTRRD